MWGVLLISFEARCLGHCLTKHGTLARGSPSNAAGQAQGTRETLSAGYRSPVSAKGRIWRRAPANPEPVGRCDSVPGRWATPRGGSARKFAPLH